MAIVVPTILANDITDYDRRLERIAPFISRVHIDISDGEFAPTRTIDVEQVHLDGNVLLDFHLMCNHPERQLEAILKHAPHLVIWHHEAHADHEQMHAALTGAGVMKGIGILPETSVRAVRAQRFDHALVFTGRLGHNGGVMDTAQLSKISELKNANPIIEVSVDGGVNAETGQLAAERGADVLYSGNFISGAANPRAVYDSLCEMAK